MICPRCGSGSLLRSHKTLSCLPCGHVLEEPAREVWDSASPPRGSGQHLGPPWTEAERLLWEAEAGRTV
jgi:hypothetical protein